MTNSYGPLATVLHELEELALMGARCPALKGKRNSINGPH
jgi:hypothetical protein